MSNVDGVTTRDTSQVVIVVVMVEAAAAVEGAIGTNQTGVVVTMVATVPLTTQGEEGDGGTTGSLLVLAEVVVAADGWADTAAVSGPGRRTPPTLTLGRRVRSVSMTGNVTKTRTRSIGHREGVLWTRTPITGHSETTRRPTTPTTGHRRSVLRTTTPITGHGESVPKTMTLSIGHRETRIPRITIPTTDHLESDLMIRTPSTGHSESVRETSRTPITGQKNDPQPMTLGRKGHVVAGVTMKSSGIARQNPGRETGGGDQDPAIAQGDIGIVTGVHRRLGTIGTRLHRCLDSRQKRGGHEIIRTIGTLSRKKREILSQKKVEEIETQTAAA